LQKPEEVFAEVFRVLKPGGVFIVSFSNRMFYEKAVSGWRDGTGYSRSQLVKVRVAFPKSGATARFTSTAPVTVRTSRW
jgi:predicted methyltransferase